MMPFGSEGGSHSITTVRPDVDVSLGADKPRGPVKSSQKKMIYGRCKITTANVVKYSLELRRRSSVCFKRSLI